MSPTPSGSSLAASVLVLNRTFVAVHVVGVRRAFGLIYREIAEIVDVDDGHFGNFDFQTWLWISEIRWPQGRQQDEWVRSVNFRIQVPRVIRLLNFERLPHPSLRFSRRNVFARDRHQCQYCGQHAPPQQLSMDHVVPRSRGGVTNWENIVCCCLKCNTRKGGRTPHEARMQLLKKPVKPRFNPVLAQKLENPKYGSWRAFLKAS